MASYQADLSKQQGCHIMPCRNSACQPFLCQVVKLLEENQVQCVADYDPGGLYKDCFQKAFDKASCTVLHVCTEIIRKVHLVEDVLKREPGKAWFIRLESCDTSEADPPLLLEFNVKDLSTPEKKAQFLDSLLVRCGGSDSAASAGNATSSQSPRSPRFSTSRQPPSSPQDRERQSTADVFHPLPMVLRLRTSLLPSVNKSFISLDPNLCSVQISGIEKKALALKDIPTEDHAYLAHIIMVDLHQRNELISLTCFACSCHFQFRLEALYLITDLLLEKGSTFSRETFLGAETFLFKSLEQQMENEVSTHHSRDYPRELVDCTEFFVFVYLLLMSKFLLRPEHAHNDNQLCQSILERPLFQVKKSGSFTMSLKSRVGVTPSSKTLPAWFLALKRCLREWSAQNFEKAKQNIYSMISSSCPPQSLWSCVPSWRLPVTFSLLVECLCKSFQKPSKPPFLDFITSFRPKKDEHREEFMTLQRMTASLLIVGINTFLQHNCERLSSLENFQSQCHQIIASLNKMVSDLDLPSRKKCVFLMTPLLFSMNKTLRQCTGSLLRGHSSYYECIWDLLLLETILIFWPLLSASNIKPNSKPHNSQSWVVIPSVFNKCKVQTHIHRPTTTEHMNHNGTKEKIITKLDRYFRELELLKKLKHENVVSLVAFHNWCCPQVYITEDYLTTALQRTLVNKSKNSHHFSMMRLLDILLDALKGVQYCHENKIVHRDLTAANVFITAEGKGKLAGFKHALKLSKNSVIKDFDLRFMATRWSAPESHQQCCFSLTSDMWMVGHFMYEVLTHGQLPYADIRKPDEDLMPLVVAGEKRLSAQRCIPKKLQDLIMNLTVVREADRKISAQNVISRIHSIRSSAEWSEDLCRFFPDLQSDNQAATKHEKGPILSLMDDFPGIELPTDMQEEEEEEEISGSGVYMKVGNKKGPVHFVKPCPKSFMSEEWDTLCQEDLPSITKLIGRPQEDSSGQTVLPFRVATCCTLYSLEEAVKGQVLGANLQPYLQCLQQLAGSIAYLHSRRIILCDFSARTIHVEETSEESRPFNVWITSLPQIKVLSEGSEQERHVDLHPPQQREQRERSAPEVLQHGQYSPASDVYCLSMLVWWVLNAFDLISRGIVDQASDSPLASVPLSQLYENVASSQGFSIPDCCPAHLSKVMNECWDPTPNNRPRVAVLQRNLTMEGPRVTEMDQDEFGYEPITIANASEADSLSDASSISSCGHVSVGNPSEASDTDLEEDEEYLDMPSGVKKPVKPETEGSYIEDEGGYGIVSDTPYHSNPEGSVNTPYAEGNEASSYLDQETPTNCSFQAGQDPVYKTRQQEQKEDPSSVLDSKVSHLAATPCPENTNAVYTPVKKRHSGKKTVAEDVKISTDYEDRADTNTPPPLPPRYPTDLHLPVAMMEQEGERDAMRMPAEQSKRTGRRPRVSLPLQLSHIFQPVMKRTNQKSKVSEKPGAETAPNSYQSSVSVFPKGLEDVEKRSLESSDDEVYDTLSPVDGEKLSEEKNAASSVYEPYDEHRAGEKVGAQPDYNLDRPLPQYHPCGNRRSLPPVPDESSENQQTQSAYSHSPPPRPLSRQVLPNFTCLSLATSVNQGQSPPVWPQTTGLRTTEISSQGEVQSTPHAADGNSTDSQSHGSSQSSRVYDRVISIPAGVNQSLALAGDNRRNVEAKTEEPQRDAEDRQVFV